MCSPVHKHLQGQQEHVSVELTQNTTGTPVRQYGNAEAAMWRQSRRRCLCVCLSGTVATQRRLHGQGVLKCWLAVERGASSAHRSAHNVVRTHKTSPCVRVKRPYECRSLPSSAGQHGPYIVRATDPIIQNCCHAVESQSALMSAPSRPCAPSHCQASSALCQTPAGSLIHSPCVLEQTACLVQVLCLVSAHAGSCLPQGRLEAVLPASQQAHRSHSHARTQPSAAQSTPISSQDHSSNQLYRCQRCRTWSQCITHVVCCLSAAGPAGSNTTAGGPLWCCPMQRTASQPTFQPGQASRCLSAPAHSKLFVSDLTSSHLTNQRRNATDSKLLMPDMQRSTNPTSRGAVPGPSLTAACL